MRLARTRRVVSRVTLAKSWGLGLGLDRVLVGLAKFGGPARLVESRQVSSAGRV